MHLRLALFALLTASLPLTACLRTEVTCADGDCGGDHDSVSTSSTTGTGGDVGGGGGDVPVEGSGGASAGSPTALAYRHADLPGIAGDDSGSSAVSGGGDPGIDPDMLVVFVSDQAMVCANPWGPLACGLHWSASIDIPVALQKPGTYPIAVQADDAHVAVFVSSTGEGDGLEDCSFGGGTALDGWVDVTSVDDTGVRGHLHTGTFDPAIGDLDLDFDAPRCD